MTDNNRQRYVKPARQGLVVRQPHNARPLPAEGAWVAWNSYWMRRMAEGSVVKGTPPKPAKRTPAKAASQPQED
ncbi:DUF2635 domain-containing protein [Halomonas sp. HG01]|uniref:DUF2635 domain-containing protein n=1 Tax=Halomonas sp. HG01 TaxID=1609967 RepID=UPI000614497E|nr:DUF2635 domain-containing protein [Halomonas sp. HG01]